MTFKLPVNLYALRPRHTLKAALKAKSDAVKPRFRGTTKTLSFTFAQLVAWTIDTGYGSTKDQTDYLSLTSQEQGELGRYLRRRLSMLIQLVQLNSVRAFVPRTFTKMLDSSEKADASFILGGLACRLAHSKWFQQRGVTVARFWHLAVYEKHAAKWISSVVDKGKSRPDFLVQDSMGQWFSAEAKGSFDDINWCTIQQGLRQVARLKSVTFTDAATQAVTTQLVKDFSCVLGHFATSSQFEASLVDPPADDSATLTLELATDFADANAFLKAIHQYHCLGRRRMPVTSKALSDLLGYETQYLGTDPYFEKPLVIGIPLVLLESEPQLNAFMRVAQHFVIAFGEYFQRRYEEPREIEETNWANFLARQSIEAAFHIEAIDDAEVRQQRNRMFELAVMGLAGSAALSREKAPPWDTWAMAMLRLAKVPMFLSGNQNISLQQWLLQLHNVIQSAALAARLEANLGRSQIDQQPGITVASSLNGLIFIHGATPQHVRREERKNKI